MQKLANVFGVMARHAPGADPLQNYKIVTPTFKVINFAEHVGHLCDERLTVNGKCFHGGVLTRLSCNMGVTQPQPQDFV